MNWNGQSSAIDMHILSAQDQIVLRYFQEKAQTPYFVLDGEGTVTAVNAFTSDLLGESSVTGVAFKDLIIDFQNSFTLEDVVDQGQSCHLLSLNIPHSLPRSYSFSFHRHGAEILVFGNTDMDESELLRKELLRANQELHNLTRTLHKKNGQLQQLNAIKNQFLGMAAHDLRKPISVILSYSEFLLDETRAQLNEEHYGFLKTIESSSYFMKRLVDDFLDVSAIEAGSLHLNIEPIQLIDILERSMILINLLAAKKNVRIHTDADSSLPTIRLDADKIEQALSNLLGNAVEHSMAGSTVTIRLKDAGEQILFSVQNSGPGIAEDEMHYLFSPFSKTSTAKTGGEKSTGLGLTIARKIVEAHHGEIRAESTVGQGTIFYINLPKG